MHEQRAFTAKSEYADPYPHSSALGALGLAVAAGIFAYILTFVQVGFPLSSAAEFAVLSVLSAAIPGLVVWKLTHLMHQTSPILQAAFHLPLSLGYSWVWYLVGRWIGAGLDVIRGYDWAVSWLPANALAWQLTQGLSVYAAIVAGAYAVGGATKKFDDAHPEPISGASSDGQAELRVTRYLAKSGEGFASFDVSEIVVVEGADDYSEVTVVSGEKRLVRLSLKAFEAQLGSSNFVRVHRSILLALDQLVSAEPAGAGRMLLHLTTGRVIQTSREGARKLRARMI